MDRLSESHQAFDVHSTVEAMTAVRRFEAQWDVSNLIRHPELFQRQDGPRLSDDNIPSFEKILIADLSSGRLDSHLIARLTKKASKTLKLPTSRTRLDKQDFQLDIYDRVKKGEKLTQLRDNFESLAYKKSLSTVRTAYESACLKIHGKIIPPEELPLLGFDPKQNDIRNSCGCIAEKLCPKHEAYANQDFGGLLGKLGSAKKDEDDSSDLHSSLDDALDQQAYRDWLVGSR